MKIFLFAAALLGLYAYASAGTGFETVTGFDVNRYLGKWHEVARLDHTFERGLTAVTAEYTLRSDGGVDVVNSGWSAKKGKRKKAQGRAYFRGDRTEGKLKVSFFRPFYGAYNIVELDKDNYSWALVAGPNTKYLWILARSPELPKEVQDRLIAKAKALGFDTDKLIFPGTAEAAK